MPHVLVVAWDGAAPSASRTNAVVAALLAAGARVTVLTSDVASPVLLGGTDEPLPALPDGAAVLRVALPLISTDPVVSRWPLRRVRRVDLWEPEAAAAEVLTFPEPVFGAWQPRLDAAAYRLHRADPVDLVVAAGPPYVCLTPAMHLAVELDVPFVLEDRGDWLAQVDEQDDHAGQYLALLVARCRQAWLTTDDAARDWAQRFPDLGDRLRVVPDAALPGAAADVLAGL